MKEEQTIYELPSGWKQIQLGKACKKISLNGIKIKQKDYLQKGKYPVVDQGQDLVGGYHNDDKLVVPNEPPYIVFGDHTKIKKYITFKFVAGADGVKVLKPSNDFDPKFFYYSLYTVKVPDKGYARHFQFLEKAIIPLPPKETQQQIVSKIEELFSELDKGIEELKTAQQQLKIYRQAVLKWAFEGKLTNEDVKDGELPEGWKTFKLKDMSETIQYGYTESSSKEAVGPKFLRITDIQDNKVNWEEVPYCKIDDELKGKFILKEGDLLFARTGATVGKSYLIKGEIPEAVFASYLIRVRVNQAMNEKYLSYFFHSNNYWSQVTAGQVGIGQPNVNGTKLGQLKIIVAPLEKQQQIVQEIESRLSVCDKIEEIITDSLKQAEALRQSILKKAFDGKLFEGNTTSYPSQQP